jgi:hypothetical protein
VYANYGDLAPLDKLYELKEKYKYVVLHYLHTRARPGCTLAAR